MGCLLNILWHFPFLGFIFALLYAIFGVIMCCTIILLPIGMAWFQIAKFMLAPFSSAMVSRSDYEMITGKKQNEAYATFSLVIRILYFPFGCIAAFFSVFNIAFGFLSIVGIPIALVHTKLFKTYFNPIGKVCVPKAVGDEIERIKSAEIVGKYTGRNMQANVSCASACTVPEPEECVREDNRPQVRRFDDARLEEIVNNPDMYNAELVAQCRREIEIRIKSESLSEKVAGFDDGKLREIMSSVGVYADELIYSCEKEYDRRAQLRREEMERAQEQARIEREKEAEAERAAAAAERERRILWWKKWRVAICSAVLLLVVSGSAIYLYRRHIEQERIEQERIIAEQERRAEMDRKRLEEQRRLEEQQRIEREKREAEARRREQQRKEAERLKEEERKILADESYRRSVGAYLVGEYHEKLNGIVFWVDKTYKHGKVMSIAEMQIIDMKNISYGDLKDAKQWCKSLGGKWRLPTIKEWESLTKEIKNNTRLNLKKDYHGYWSSSPWTSKGHYWVYDNKYAPNGRSRGERDSWHAYARAVAEF